MRILRDSSESADRVDYQDLTSHRVWQTPAFLQIINEHPELAHSCQGSFSGASSGAC